MCHEILTKYINEVDNDVRLFLTSSFPDKSSYSFHRNTAETGYIQRISLRAQAQKDFSAFRVLYFNFNVFVSGQFLYRFHSVKLKLCK